MILCVNKTQIQSKYKYNSYSTQCYSYFYFQHEMKALRGCVSTIRTLAYSTECMIRIPLGSDQYNNFEVADPLVFIMIPDMNCCPC